VSTRTNIVAGATLVAGAVAVSAPVIMGPEERAEVREEAGPQLRRMSADHVAGVEGLLRAYRSEAGADENARNLLSMVAPCEAGRDFDEGALRELVRDNWQRSVVLEEGGAVVGAAIIGKTWRGPGNQDYVHIRVVVLDAAHFGKGLVRAYKRFTREVISRLEQTGKYGGVMGLTPRKLGKFPGYQHGISELGIREQRMGKNFLYVIPFSGIRDAMTLEVAVDRMG